jgi:Caspase domain
MKRRIFLQSGIAYGTALGVGKLLLGNAQTALALPMWSKFAVLMGVDEYPQDSLKGGVTDVELQANLLIQRFGFDPQNVHKLTNRAATIAGLEAALAELAPRIKPDDLLWVHFSGKGTTDLEQQPLLLLSGDEPLLLSELGLRLKGSGTKQVITVLDTGFQRDERSAVGHRRWRSAALDDRSSALAGTVSQPPDLAAAALPGMVLSAGVADQAVVEVDYPDFSAGQFTYGLTQALWLAASPSALDPARLGAVTGTKREQQFLNGLLAERSRPATIGALIKRDPTGLAGTVWLGGLPAAQVALINPPAQLQTGGQTLQVLSRQGLQAVVQVQAEDGTATPLTMGTPIAEQLRILPRDLALVLAIDPSLSKVERVDAVSAFSSLANVETKLLGAGPDYILAKIQDPNLVAALPDAAIKAVLPAPRYALLGDDRQPIATAVSESGAAVKTMVKKLGPIVEALYADKVLRLLENQAASQLALTVVADQFTPKPQFVFRRSTAAVEGKLEPSALRRLTVGTQLRYQATNRSTLPLYWLLLGWNSRHETYVVLPPAEPIASGSTTDLAFREQSTDWSVRAPLGLATVYLVASDRPFTQTATALKPLTATTPETYLYPLAQPLGVMQALIQDLAAPGIESPTVYGLDMARYVVMPLQYQVI